MDAQNLLIIMSDQHNKKMSGCYGHGLVKTPNLDALAARGTLFDACYTCSPVCVPARAAFATGRYIHEIGYWDNADPYDGKVTSWHHQLRDAGHRVVSIGKLHFRSEKDDNGFSEEIIPMHVVEGTGDLFGLVRDDMPERGAAWKMAEMAGPGESPYTRYDREIAVRSQAWLSDEAPKYRDKPWVLFVSFVTPHYPLTAPEEHYRPYYENVDLPWPKAYAEDERPDHPYIGEYAATFNFDEYFDTDDKVRRAIAGYFGLCSFMDEQVGRVLGALKDSGLGDKTRIAYTSDHGDNLGARGIWGKSVMYEEVASVPLILAGADIPAGETRHAPVSHVDFYPFIMEAVGETGEAGYPGLSLFDLARGEEPERTVLSEYHGMGSTAGAFMIRDGRYKYVHYIAHPPQLFDLESDPEELDDLAPDPAHRKVLAQCEAKLRAICAPEEVDGRAKRRQAEQLARAGGREAVIARGDLGFTPPPGFDAEFA